MFRKGMAEMDIAMPKAVGNRQDCRLYIFGPQALPDTAHPGGTYLLLCLIFLALQIWVAVKGNEMTAKNLLEYGWSFSNPNSQETRFPITKWNLSS